jgi:1-acyl-sn-glycerol-3-phosphate acyltransferase
MAANHLGRLDAPLLFTIVDRDDFTGWVAKKYQKVPLLRRLVDALHGIWIDRYNPDVQALRQAKAHLRRGGMLGIAPEGTRSPTRALIPAKPGTAFLASMVDVPVVPAAIWGTETVTREWLHLRRPQIHVRFGKPFRVSEVGRKGREKALQRNADEIMCHIAAMLPPPYHGVYRRHPRLVALLSQSG